MSEGEIEAFVKYGSENDPKAAEEQTYDRLKEAQQFYNHVSVQRRDGSTVETLKGYSSSIFPPLLFATLSRLGRVVNLPSA